MKLFCALSFCCFLLLAGCGHVEPKKPADDELRRMLENARTAFDRGQLEQAAGMYEEALDRAKLIDRPREIGNAAYNLSLILISQGDYPAAERHLREAQAEFERVQENLADVLLARARLAQFQDNYSELAHLAEQALVHPQSQPEPGHRVQALVLLGLAGLHEERLPEAERRLQQAIEAMPSDPALPLEALVVSLEGTLLRYREQPLAAANSFDEEANFWRGAQLYREMAAALRRAGESWLAGGDERNAANRLFRAARSFAEQGLTEPALGSLRQAKIAADLAEDDWMLQQISDLQRKLGQAVDGNVPPSH